MDYKYNGIMLSKFDVAETDRIYTIYTLEAGKMRVLAKGVRKSNAKLAGSLETLTSAEIFVARSRGMGKITGAIVTDNFLNLKSNLEALNQVFYALKFFQKMITDQEKDEKSFLLLLEYLKAMDTIDTRMGQENILTPGFLFKLLEVLGYRLEMERCAICRKKLKSDDNFFSMEKGGAICADCARTENRKIKISDGSIKLIRIFLKNKVGNFSKIRAEKKDVNDLKIISEEAARWIIG